MSFIHPAARLELEESTRYYLDISFELAERFLDDFDQTLSFIESMPLAWPMYYKDMRKLNLKFFPYSIIYNISVPNNEINIFAFSHQYKKPFYWIERL